MAWVKTNPADDELLINFPAQARANWAAIELGTDTALKITNAKVAAAAGIVDTKLATISTAGKVNGAALTGLASIPAGAGNIPEANLGNAVKGPVSNTDGYIPLWDGADSKTLKAGVELDTDGGLTANSDTKVASQKATKTAIDAKVTNLVDDATPQLGGDLDLNGHNLDFPSVSNISDVKDEDDMASDSATMLATQQSIKAYVDSQVPTSGFWHHDGTKVVTNGASGGDWTDIDLSSYVGSNRALVMMRVESQGYNDYFLLRTNGEDVSIPTGGDSGASGVESLNSGNTVYLMCETDANGVIEYRNNASTDIYLQGYIK